MMYYMLNVIYNMVYVAYKNLIKFILKYNKVILSTLLILVIFYLNYLHNSEKLPSVLIVSLIRNKAHTLPYFFSYLESLDYPKSRLTLLLQSDHNEDNSIELINLWLNRTSKEYNNVKLQFQSEPKRYQHETSPNDWPKERISHVIKLKEEALKIGQQLLVDFIFFLDADVFLTNHDTLKILTSLKLPIVLPLLVCEGPQSNFQANVDKYKKLYQREKIDNFRVPIVYSSVFISSNFKLIQESNDLPDNDIFNIPISGDFVGYILQPLRNIDEINKDYEKLLNTKLDIINDLGTEIDIKNEFKKYIIYPEKNKLSLDHIYVINLVRRPDRRKKMELSLKELSLDVEYFPAIDGKTLNLSIIKEMGIKILSDTRMRMGQIGCFLSHYKIWQKIIERGQKEVLILEDDIKFKPNFHINAINTLSEARKAGNWDLLYFGRRPLEFYKENWVKESTSLVHVKHSYGTFAYVITLKGAKKLIDIKPLQKLLPADEFLCIMFNESSFNRWCIKFEPRNLLAYSADPVLINQPSIYENNRYLSDVD